MLVTGPAKRASRWELAVLGLVVLASLLLRWERAVDHPNLLGSDPATRALFAEGLRAHGLVFLYERTPWLPLHFFLLAGARALVDDADLAARLPGLLAGGLSPALAWWLTRRSLGVGSRTAQAALAAASLVASEGLGLGLAGLSFAEIVAPPLVLGGLAAARGRSRPELAAAVLLLGGAAALRYELWPLAVVLLASPALPLRWRPLAALVALGPALGWTVARPRFVLLNSAVRHHPHELLQVWLPERVAAVAAWAADLGEFGLPWLLPMAAVGGWVAWRSGQRALPLSALGLALVIPATALVGHVPLFDRYLVVPLALASVLAAWPLAVAERAWLRWVWFALVLAQVGAGVATGRGYGIPQAEELDHVAQALARRSDQAPAVPVVIDPGRHTASYLYWKAELPWERISGLYRDPERDPRFYAELYAMVAGNPRLLVAVDGGPAARWLELEPGACEPLERGDGLLACLDRVGAYSLWVSGPRRSPPQPGVDEEVP